MSSRGRVPLRHDVVAARPRYFQRRSSPSHRIRSPRRGASTGNARKSSPVEIWSSLKPQIMSQSNGLASALWCLNRLRFASSGVRAEWPLAKPKPGTSEDLPARQGSARTRHSVFDTGPMATPGLSPLALCVRASIGSSASSLSGRSRSGTAPGIFARCFMLNSSTNFRPSTAISNGSSHSPSRRRPRFGGVGQHPQATQRAWLQTACARTHRAKPRRSTLRF